MFGIFFSWVDYLCGEREVECSFRLVNAGDIRSMSTLCNELIFWGDGCSNLSSGTYQVNWFDVHWVKVMVLSFLRECNRVIGFQLDFASIKYKGRGMGQFLSFLCCESGLLQFLLFMSCEFHISEE